MKKLKRRFLPLMLCLVMLLSGIPEIGYGSSIKSVTINGETFTWDVGNGSLGDIEFRVSGGWAQMSRNGGAWVNVSNTAVTIPGASIGTGVANFSGYEITTQQLWAALGFGAFDWQNIDRFFFNNCVLGQGVVLTLGYESTYFNYQANSNINARNSGILRINGTFTNNGGFVRGVWGVDSYNTSSPPYSVSQTGGAPVYLYTNKFVNSSYITPGHGGRCYWSSGSVKGANTTVYAMEFVNSGYIRGGAGGGHSQFPYSSAIVDGSTGGDVSIIAETFSNTGHIYSGLKGRSAAMDSASIPGYDQTITTDAGTHAPSISIIAKDIHDVGAIGFVSSATEVVNSNDATLVFKTETPGDVWKQVRYNQGLKLEIATPDALTVTEPAKTLKARSQSAVTVAASSNPDEMTVTSPDNVSITLPAKTVKTTITGGGAGKQLRIDGQGQNVTAGSITWTGDVAMTNLSIQAPLAVTGNVTGTNLTGSGLSFNINGRSTWTDSQFASGIYESTGPILFDNSTITNVSISNQDEVRFKNNPNPSNSNSYLNTRLNGIVLYKVAALPDVTAGGLVQLTMAELRNRYYNANGMPAHNNMEIAVEKSTDGVTYTALDSVVKNTATAPQYADVYTKINELAYYRIKFRPEGTAAWFIDESSSTSFMSRGGSIDDVPPTVQFFELNNGVAQTLNATVPVDVVATDNRSSQSQLMYLFTVSNMEGTNTKKYVYRAGQFEQVMTDTYDSLAANRIDGLPLLEGKNRVKIEVKDQVGNIGTATKLITRGVAEDATLQIPALPTNETELTAFLERVSIGSKAPDGSDLPGKMIQYNGRYAFVVRDGLIRINLNHAANAPQHTFSTDGVSYSERWAKDQISELMLPKNGLNLLNVRPANLNGQNGAPATYLVIVDDVEPTVVLRPSVRKTVAQTGQTYNWSVYGKDNVSAISSLEYRINGTGAWTKVSGTTISAGIARGSNQFIVEFRDEAGNIQTIMNAGSVWGL